jgi:DNA topoisomerase-3
MSAWIDSNRGKTRRKSNRRTTSKSAESITSQSTTPSKRPRKRKAGADAAMLAPAPTNSVTGTPLQIPYGNKDVALKLGARYGSAGWYAPPGVDLSKFGERGWL